MSRDGMCITARLAAAVPGRSTWKSVQVDSPNGGAARAASDGRPRRRSRRQRIAVYGVCRNEAGDILLTRGAAHLTVAGRWFLPGGGIDHGEHPVTALARELTEETGFEVEVGSLLGVLSDSGRLPDGTDLHTVRIIYEIASYKGELRFEADGSTDLAAWFTPEQAFALPIMPYVKRVLSDFVGIPVPPAEATSG
jgi:8-oxo-dGTP diphosphatase